MPCSPLPVVDTNIEVRLLFFKLGVPLPLSCGTLIAGLTFDRKAYSLGLSIMLLFLVPDNSQPLFDGPQVQLHGFASLRSTRLRT